MSMLQGFALTTAGFVIGLGALAAGAIYLRLRAPEFQDDSSKEGTSGT